MTLILLDGSGRDEAQPSEDGALEYDDQVPVKRCAYMGKFPNQINTSVSVHQYHFASDKTPAEEQ